MGPSNNSTGHYGLHNAIEEINETTGLVETVDHRPLSGCVDCTHVNEASSNFCIIEQPLIFKADGSEIKNLEELVQYNDESELVIDYYCADEDNAAEMVMIWGETKRPESICKGDHSGHTPLTNAEALRQ